MTRGADVLVVGGGIAGLTIALAAAARGMAVTVLDSPRTGSASRTAAGMLAPSLDGLPEHVRGLALEARDFYPEFLAMLHERAEMQIPLNREGILELAASDQELSAIAARAGREATLLDTTALARLEPAYVGHAGAVLHPFDGCVDNVALMYALDLAVAREPRVTRLETDVVSVEREAAHPFVRSAAGTLEAPCVALAAGAWLNGIRGLPRPFPVRPVRGQLLTLDCAPVSHVTYGGGGYLVPRGARLLVGATSEETAFELSTTPAGRSELCAVAERAIPALRGATVLDHWAGFRPMSPDGMPVLGAEPDDPRILYAGGFSRNGILFAPWAAEELAATIAGERGSSRLDSFSVARFGQAVTG